MKLTVKQLRQLIKEEFKTGTVANEARLRPHGDLYDVDIYELIQFAKAYAYLGSAVQDQLDALLHGNSDDFDVGVNSNAVKLIERELGGANSDIDDALRAYESWFQGGNYDDHDDDDEPLGH